MHIEKTQPKEVDEVFHLLKLCGDHMRSSGIMQWNENYPLKSHVETDIERSSMYCLKDENSAILGIVVIDENQSPEYKTVNWKHTETPILVVHRFAVLPTQQKAGIGKQLMDFVLNYAVTNQYKSIRLDAYSGNERTLKFYLNRGYSKVGEINFPYRTKHFDCFEKKL